MCGGCGSWHASGQAGRVYLRLINACRLLFPLCLYEPVLASGDDFPQGRVRVDAAMRQFTLAI